MSSTTQGIKTSTDKLADVAYTSLSYYGKMWAFGLFCCAVATLVVGIFILATNASPCTQYITATVAQSCGFTSCCSVDTSSSDNYTCNLLLDYTVNGTAYTDVPLLVHSADLYSAGQKVQVCYSTDDAKQITLRQPDNTTVGIIITAVGAVAVIGTSILNFKVWSSKKNAAAFGGFEALSTIV